MQVRPEGTRPPSPLFVYPWHSGMWLIQQGGALYLCGPQGCSCSEWHRTPSRPCAHQEALAAELLAQGEALIARGRALLAGARELTPELAIRPPSDPEHEMWSRLHNWENRP